MPSSPAPALRPPRQSRSRKTLDRIVGAALELLEERGAEGTTVQEIVHRSGTSVGSFYQRFASKDDLLRYLEERVWEEAVERWEEAKGAAEGKAGDEPARGGARPEDVPAGTGRPHVHGALERMVAALVHAYRSDFRVRSALSSSGEPTGTGGDGRRSFRDRVRADVRRAVLASDFAEDKAHPEQTAEVAFRLLLGGLRELAAAAAPEAEPSLSLTDEELARELTRALLGYLGAGAPGGGLPAGADKGPPDDVDPFDIWS